MRDDFYKTLAHALLAYQHCTAAGKYQMAEDWKRYIEFTVKEYAPSGSGFDDGTRFDIDASEQDKLIFETAYHHMNDAGYYVGWSEHTVIVIPSFIFGADIRVTGKNKNGIKDYIYDTFYQLRDVRPKPFHEWRANNATAAQ